jgi:hypothetical protein
VPAFRKPSFDFPWNAADEIKALRNYPKLPGKEDRAIPPKGDNRLLLATWNIANLGLQQRRQKDYQLIAEILGWFDLAAIQEVNGNLDGLDGIRKELSERYRVVLSDPGGNNERFAFLYDSEKVEPLEEVGEVTIAGRPQGREAPGHLPGLPGLRPQPLPGLASGREAHVLARRRAPVLRR